MTLSTSICQQLLPLPVGKSGPHLAHGSLGPPLSPYPKRHLDWFSHVCRAHSCVQHSCTQTDHATYIGNTALAVVSHTHTHTHPFNGPFSGTTRVSRYQKGKTNLDFTEATDSEWQWHQLGCMQVCTSLQTDNHVSTPPLSFLQAGCPSCRPTNSVKALKAFT